MKKWYLKWWVWFLVIVAALIIPFVINESYKAGEGYKTSWGASDVLAFYGSFLSFVGTVILGVVALYQSYKANCLSERLLKLEEEKNIPIVDIAEVADESGPLALGAYQNAMHISINAANYYFNVDNTLGHFEEPIFIFVLKNIGSNYIISVELLKVEQKVHFSNGETIETSIWHISYTAGIKVLDCGEKQFITISGVDFSYPKELTEEKALELEYINPCIEIVLTFALKNVKGIKYIEKIKFHYAALFGEGAITYPCLLGKEIISIDQETD